MATVVSQHIVVAIPCCAHAGNRHVIWGCAEQVIECFHGVQEGTPSEFVLVSPSQSPSTAVGAAQTFPDAPAAPPVAPPSPSA